MQKLVEEYNFNAWLKLVQTSEEIVDKPKLIRYTTTLVDWRKNEPNKRNEQITFCYNQEQAEKGFTWWKGYLAKMAEVDVI